MATKLNKEAFDYAKKLIKEGKYEGGNGDWSQHQPSTQEENTFIDKSSMDEYGKWHLGLDGEEKKETKDRYKFPFGDYKIVHRGGLVAIKQRAAQHDYKDIEDAADQLMELMEQQGSKGKH